MLLIKRFAACSHPLGRSGSGPHPTFSDYASRRPCGGSPSLGAAVAEWAYYHALKRDGGLPHEGATLNAMLAAVNRNGQPAENQWPYIKAPITDVSTWKPPASPAQLFFRDHGLCGATVQQVIDQLNAGSPVLMTMTLSDAFLSPDADGVIAANEPTDPKRRHAVVAVGHGKRGAAGLVLIRNSWGEAWGLKGCAWITTAYLTPRLTGAAIMTTEP